ncbi:hypothetical protein DPMN_093257 [Dreissena polymorpha]|uniref:Apple domain-containing protein n=1 Tax=Dreissena polymorpha TaxID=45954 RepID=A0A9D4R0U9_DREPO|nr:hypothetical protein DPMN_093257 [Dreissena polymorpha]
MNVDHDRIRKNIDTYKLEYCSYLREKGQVDSCDGLVAGIELKKTSLDGYYKTTQVGLSSECVEKCLEDVECVAATICTGCNSTVFSYNTCYMFSENRNNGSTIRASSPNWQSNIFSEKLNSQIKYINTRINGVARGFENDDNKKANLTTCRTLCI